MMRLVAFGLALVMAAPAFAQDTAPPKDLTVGGSVTLVSDYRFRGVSQTGGGAAAQATLTLDHVSGVYAGVFASTIADTGRAAFHGGYGQAEVDPYVGYTRSLGGATIDGGLLYYAFPDASGGRGHGYFEPYVTIGYTIGPIAAKIGGNYAWGGQGGLAFAGDRDDDLYLHGEASIAVPRTPVTLKAHVGHTAGALGRLDPSWADDDYWDWSLGAQAVGGPIRVGITYIDTDIAERGDLARRLGRGSTVLGSVGFAF